MGVNTTKLGKFLENYAKRDDVEVAMYGLYHMVLSLAGLLLSIMIGAVMKDTIAVVSFLLFFIPLRKFAGGFHAKHLYICGIISSGIIIIIIFANKLFNGLFLPWMRCFTYLGSLLILKESPVDTPVKRLFSYEKKKYKRIVGVLLIAYLLFLEIAVSYEANIIICGIFYTIIIQSVSTFIGARFNGKITKSTGSNSER